MVAQRGHTTTKQVKERQREGEGGRRDKGLRGRGAKTKLKKLLEKSENRKQRTENLSNHAQLLKYINVIIISTGQHAESLTACSKRQPVTATTTTRATPT